MKNTRRIKKNAKSVSTYKTSKTDKQIRTIEKNLAQLNHERNRINKLADQYKKNLKTNGSRTKIPELHIASDTEFASWNKNQQRSYLKKASRLTTKDFKADQKYQSDLNKKVNSEFEKRKKDAIKKHQKISDKMLKQRAIDSVVQNEIKNLDKGTMNLIRQTKGSYAKLSELSIQKSGISKFASTTKKMVNKNFVTTKGEEIVQQLNLKNKIVGELGQLKKIVSTPKEIGTINKGIGLLRAGASDQSIELVESMVKGLIPKLAEGALGGIAGLIPTLISIGLGINKEQEEKKDDIIDDTQKTSVPNNNKLQSAIGKWEEFMSGIIEAMNMSWNGNSSDGSYINQVQVIRFKNYLDSVVKMKEEFGEMMISYIPQMVPSAFDYGSENNNMRLSDTIADIAKRIKNRNTEFVNSYQKANNNK